MLIKVSSKIERTQRVEEIESLFSLPAEDMISRSWNIELPLEERTWSVGLIVGPSGAGKSTVAKRLWPLARTAKNEWTNDKPLIEEFPTRMKTKAIAELLTSVGFSTIPAWLRPFETLSTGEQFRTAMARAISETEEDEILVVDEFTSTVDRQVAQIASAATARAARKKNIKLICLTCHSDVVEWLQPDWIYQPQIEQFEWYEKNGRPDLELTVYRAKTEAWEFFKHHHYLSQTQTRASQKFVAVTNNRVAAMTSVLYQPHPKSPGFREHRSVCLPDFQGVGIGHALADYVAGMFKATDLPYRSVTSHPAMIYHRAKSKKWKMKRPPCMLGIDELKGWEKTTSNGRMTASFEWCGPSESEAAEFFGLIPERED